MSIVKYVFIAILFIFSQCTQKKWTNEDRELVVKQLGLKKWTYEKYYRIKNKKNWLGEDLLDSIRITYYKSGRLNGIEYYNDDLLDGWSISYDEDGKILIKQLWEADFRKRTSETVKIINYGYYEDGKLATIYVCDKSGKVISETAYDRNGKIIP